LSEADNSHPGGLGHTRALTLVVASALFMESLVSTVIATSLAAMADDLQVDPLTLKLSFTAYYLALAMFIPISGWCADRYGCRRSMNWTRAC
jgi:MFS family permease